MDPRAAEAVVKRWLYSPRSARQVDIRAALEWADTRVTEMALAEVVDKIASDSEATDFLREYAASPDDFDVGATAYFEALLHRQLKPFRRYEKLRREFPDLAPEEAIVEIGKGSTSKALDYWEMLRLYVTLQIEDPLFSSPDQVADRVRRQLTALVERFERLRGHEDPARAPDLPRLLNVVRPPEETLDICFTISQREEIGSGQRLPVWLIDEPGEVACLRLLEVRRVAVAFHDLRRRRPVELPAKWYQPRDVLLSGAPNSQYSNVDKLLEQLAPGRRVIDIGSNAGLVALLAAGHGARSVVGLERRQSYFDQALEMLAHWREQGLLPADADVRFVRSDVGGALELFDGGDLFLFLKVLYHISSSGSESTPPSQRQLDKDKVVRVFDRLRHRKDAVIVVRANLERERRARREKSAYGNKLALPEFIVPFLAQFGFEGITIGRDLVVARHRESAFDLERLRDAVTPAADG